LGEPFRALFVKTSGVDLAECEPEDHAGLELEPLLALRALSELPDEAMVDELMRRRLSAGSGQPSIEALVHAFLPAPFVDHTHADAILALTDQAGGEALVRQALGADLLVIPYVAPGFPLARGGGGVDASGARAMVWMHHGLTWGAPLASSTRPPSRSSRGRALPRAGERLSETPSRCPPGAGIDAGAGEASGPARATVPTGRAVRSEKRYARRRLSCAGSSPAHGDRTGLATRSSPLSSRQSPCSAHRAREKIALSAPRQR
jgi:hypothetical protein